MVLLQLSIMLGTSMMVAIGAERQNLIRESVGVVMSPHQRTLLPLAGSRAVTFALNSAKQDCNLQSCRLYHVKVLCVEMIRDITNSIAFSNSLKAKIEAKSCK